MTSDFVKVGTLINGLQEEPLRRHMVLHTSRLVTDEKLRLEVIEIARAKVMSVNPVPMDVDALRFKGKGKGSPRITRRRARRTRRRAPTASPRTLRMWSVTSKKGHKKSDCVQRKADLEKAKSECRPAVPPQAVHAVHEVGLSSSSAESECALPAGRRASR